MKKKTFIIRLSVELNDEQKESILITAFEKFCLDKFPNLSLKKKLLRECRGRGVPLTELDTAIQSGIMKIVVEESPSL